MGYIIPKLAHLAPFANKPGALALPVSPSVTAPDFKPGAQAPSSGLPQAGPLVLSKSEVTDASLRLKYACTSPGVFRGIEAPCGKCSPCLARKARDQGIRSVLEVGDAASAAFVTVTYSTKALRSGADGARRDFPDWPLALGMERVLFRLRVQAGLKRARERLRSVLGSPVDGQHIRYLVVPEHGSKRGRLHHHILLLVSAEAVHLVTSAFIRECFGAWRHGIDARRKRKVALRADGSARYTRDARRLVVGGRNDVKWLKNPRAKKKRTLSDARRAASYVAGYMNKSVAGRIRRSQAYGSAPLARSAASDPVFRADMFAQMADISRRWLRVVHQGQWVPRSIHKRVTSRLNQEFRMQKRSWIYEARKTISHHSAVLDAVDKSADIPWFVGGLHVPRRELTEAERLALCGLIVRVELHDLLEAPRRVPAVRVFAPAMLAHSQCPLLAADFLSKEEAGVSLADAAIACRVAWSRQFDA